MKQILQQQKKSNKKGWMKNKSNYETRDMIKNGITNKSTHKIIKKCETPGFFYAWTFKVLWKNLSKHRVKE